MQKMSHFKDEILNGEGTVFQRLFEGVMIIIPVIVVFIYSFIFVFRGASPKYYFYKPLRMIFFIHLALGAIEYILFFVSFFNTTKTLILVLNIFNILHSISILGMCIGVSGERYWMIPTYFWIIIIKLYYSVILFTDPLSFDIFISMYYLHGFFGWGRIFFIVMSQTYLFETCAYSMSSNIGIMVSLSQALGQTNDYQYMTLFFLLITGSAIVLRIIAPSFIIDNDQTNDSLYNIFDKQQIETCIAKFEEIDRDETTSIDIDRDIEMTNEQKEEEEKIKDIKYLKKFKVLVSVLFDANKDNTITIKEFCDIFCRKMGYSMNISKKVWEFIDKERNGYIALDSAAKIFADDNPHFEVDFFIDKMYKFMKEIHKKHAKKEAITKQRTDKIDQDIANLENEYKNK